MIAQETQFLEDCSKACDTKNAITIWNKDHCYPWPEFLEQVVAEKIGALQEYFGNNEERGMAFLYHLTELLRDYDTKTILQGMCICYRGWNQRGRARRK